MNTPGLTTLLVAGGVAGRRGNDHLRQGSRRRPSRRLGCRRDGPRRSEMGHRKATATAPSAPNVLKQSGSGAFPWCVKKDVSLTDGALEVKFKPISGSEDAAGGLVWRWKDGDNYYVARANALEDNVSLLLHAERPQEHDQVRQRSRREESVAQLAHRIQRQADKGRARWKGVHRAGRRAYCRAGRRRRLDQVPTA